MRKNTTGIIKLFFIVTSILVLGNNAVKAQINVNLPTYSRPQGAAPEWINLTAGNLTGQNVNAFQFTLTYNKSVIYIDSAVSGVAAAGGYINFNADTANQQIKISFASVNTLSGSGTLVQVKVHYVGIGTSPLAFNNSFEFNNGNPAALVTEGSVSVLTQSVGVNLPTLTRSQGSAPELITVSVGNLTGQNVNAFQFTVTYNKNVIYIDSAISGSVASGGYINFNADTANQQIKVSFASSNALAGSGALVQLRVHYINAGTSPLAFNGTFKFNNGIPAASVTEGSITITPGQPPTVTTLSATNITSTSSTLNGTVNANGSTTTVQFQYGTTTVYGSTITPSQSPVNGSSNINVSANISGLTSNTLYHYRDFAKNNSDTSYGADLTFTTLSLVPNQPTLLSPENGSTGISTSPTLIWSNFSTTSGSSSINAKMPSKIKNKIARVSQTGLTNRLQVSTDSTFATGIIVDTTEADTSYTTYGLLNNKTYYWHVDATNSTGTGGWSNAWSFTTIPNQIIVITNPATNITQTSAILNGLVNPNGNITWVQFQYGMTSSYEDTITATPSPDSGSSNIAVSANISGLTPNTLYHFRALAVSSNDTSYGGDLTSTTLPSKAITSVVFSGSIGVKLQMDIKGVGFGNAPVSMPYSGNLQQFIFWDVHFTAGYVGPGVNDAVHLNYQSWSDTEIVINGFSGDYGGSWSLSPGDSVVIQVSKTDANNSSVSAIWKGVLVESLATITITSPVGGENWQVGSSENITWTSSHVTNVKIEYTTDNAVSWKPIIASTPANAGSYSCTVPNTPSSNCKVRISDTNNASVNSVSANVFTISPSPLSAVQQISPSSGSLGLIQPVQLKWMSYAGASNYRLQLGIDSIFATTLIDTAGLTDSSFIVSSLSNLTTYYWRVNAANAGGTTPWSSIWNFKTIGNPTQPVLIYPANNSVNILLTVTFQWNQSQDQLSMVKLKVSLKNAKSISNVGSSRIKKIVNVSQYQFELMTDTTTTSYIVNDSTLTDTTTLVSGLQDSTNYWWRVRAMNQAGWGAYTAWSKFSTVSNSPGTISITSPVGGENLIIGLVENITWTSSGVTNVKIDYTTDGGTPWIPIIASTSASSGSYSWIVPNTPSTNCKVRISDASNSSTYSISPSSFTIYSYPSVIVMNNSIGFSGIYNKNYYKLIGLPGETNFSLSTLMTGTQKTDWQAYWDNGADTNYQIENDGTSTFNFTPGNAFWFISDKLITLNKTVSTVPLSSNLTYSITLHSGWNLISNPFGISVPWSVVEDNNNITQPIWEFSSGSYDSSITFEPYQGYYFYNSSTSRNSLTLPYNSTLGKATKVAITGTRLSLQEGNQEIDAVSVKYDKRSQNGLDNYDIYSPGNLFVEASMNILHPEGRPRGNMLKEDVRPGIGIGQEYTLQILNTKQKNLSISITEKTIAEPIYLVDDELKQVDEIKGKIDLESISQNKTYRLIVGEQEYIEQLEKAYMPTQYSLSQNYPNPFNPATMINYSVPKAGLVTIKVYNVLGKELATLVNEQKTAGNYSVPFTATGGYASGVYFYRMQAGNYSQTRKLILLK
jgi:hypothetical protein